MCVDNMLFVFWTFDNCWQRHHLCMVFVILLSFHIVETKSAHGAFVQKPVYPPMPHANLKDTCLLESAEKSIVIWCNANGTLKIPAEAVDQYLDLSHAKHTPESVAQSVVNRLASTANQSDLKVLSVAYTTLRLLPREALAIVNGSIEQITMRGNYFHTQLHNMANQLPTMLRLRELDLCDCRIDTLGRISFAAMPNLERLLLAGNRISHLESLTFSVLPHLQHLNMAYNFYVTRPSMVNENVSKSDDEDDRAEAEVIQLNLPTDSFSSLSNLRFLDLSFTRLLPDSARLVIGRLPSCVKMLSICYTATPELPAGVFNVTKPRVLDLSGNPLLAFHLQYNTMVELASTLEVLALDDVSLQSLEFFCVMPKLQILQLAGNNINTLYDEAFTNLMALRVLDLSANRLSHWFEPALTYTPRLRILKLHDNNINLVTNAMLQEFEQLDYLSIGNNMFICSCTLRDFVDMARGIDSHDQLDGSNFRLLDYDGSRYSCINTSTSEKYAISEIAHCSSEMIETKDSRSLSALSIVAVLVVAICTLVTCLVVYKYWSCLEMVWLNLRKSSFLKRSQRGQTTKLIAGQNKHRWHIDKIGADGANKDHNNNGRNMGEDATTNVFKYDVFVSYCEQDRDWILTEFLPNMDQCDDIKVCLHERDFQVGLCILDNIISCMEESRCLLLVVSENFLKSQWCLFEMSFAQHRLMDTHQDQLILIMLEEIPQHNRPQTLQYMMRTKTYIDWPTVANRKTLSIASSLEVEQRHFWARLRCALESITNRNDKIIVGK